MILVNLVVEVPIRDEFALWKPNMLEAHLEFDALQVAFDLLQMCGHLSK